MLVTVDVVPRLWFNQLHPLRRGKVSVWVTYGDKEQRFRRVGVGIEAVGQFRRDED